MKAQVIILNYNGAELLKRNIPSFLEAAGVSKHPCRVGVLDNQSRDGSIDLLKGSFPQVPVYESPENRVLCSYNWLAPQLHEEVLIFMNNDMRVDRKFLEKLLDPFECDSSVFMVTPRCVSPEGVYEGGKTAAAVRFGVFWASSLFPGHEASMDKPGFTFQGGFGAFDRKKFIELGGYDELYLPGRLEDSDICYRAYQRGWVCVYEPSSVVYHEGGVSFNRVFGPKKTRVMNWRNTFLFMWKNLNDRTNFLWTPLWLPVRCLGSALKGRFEFVLGFWQALFLFREARKRRPGKSVRAAYLSQAEIFKKSAGIF